VAIGKSNRIVIDVDQIDLKRRLYSALAQDGRSLKDWFVAVAEQYLEERTSGRQLAFGALSAAESGAEYRPRARRGTGRNRD
jgi:hypothetical protein